MSSENSDGHIFESSTNNNAKFSMKFTKSALDEVFKVRTILRIGIQIAKDKSCFILHGQRSGISIKENVKPIILEDFQTQYNSLDCDNVDEDSINEVTFKPAPSVTAPSPLPTPTGPSTSSDPTQESRVNDGAPPTQQLPGKVLIEIS